MEARLSKLLEDAPGPAPWYWKTFPRFRLGGRTWSWHREPAEGAIEGWPVLARDGDGEGIRCFVPGWYTYLVDAGYDRLLVWRSKPSGVVEIRLYDVEALQHVELPRNQVRRERDTASQPADELVPIPSLAGGDHEGYAARLPVELDELLLLVSPPVSADRDPALAIYAWNPRSGHVTVRPQPWFTAATHDLGYEWVTKVVRDPKTRTIVGAGIRIPAFELEHDDMTVRRWLEGPPSGSG